MLIVGPMGDFCGSICCSGLWGTAASATRRSARGSAATAWNAFDLADVDLRAARCVVGGETIYCPTSRNAKKVDADVPACHLSSNIRLHQGTSYDRLPSGEGFKDLWLRSAQIQQVVLTPVISLC